MAVPASPPANANPGDYFTDESGQVWIYQDTVLTTGSRWFAADNVPSANSLRLSGGRDLTANVRSGDLSLIHI